MGSIQKAKFGKRLRRLREEKKLGLRELARRVGIHPTYLSQIELGELAPPAWDKLVALGVELESLELIQGGREQMQQEVLCAVRRYVELVSRMKPLLRDQVTSAENFEELILNVLGEPARSEAVQLGNRERRFNPKRGYEPRESKGGSRNR